MTKSKKKQRRKRKWFYYYRKRDKALDRGVAVWGKRRSSWAAQDE